MSLTTLIVDDDRAFSTLAAAALTREGCKVTLVHSLHAARGALEATDFELVVLDRRLPDGDGLEFLPALRQTTPGAAVVMVTAHGDIASAVDAIRLGAADYLAKPVELSDLLMKARRANDDRRLRDRLSRAEHQIEQTRALVPPKSKVMLELLATLERVAPTRSPVLLTGETGVGKEVLARHIHALGSTRNAAFVHVNCASLSETNAESELFGHEKGAFTDARHTKRGLVEVADGGTLFLDELGELPLAVQAKLLTFLDSKSFRRLGGTTELSSSARVVAATNRALETEMSAGRFREDLWFRLSVFRLHVPPLRDRPEDIPSLVLAALRDIGHGKTNVSESALKRLSQYPFPGNVRELRNILERAVVLEPGPVLEVLNLQPQPIARSADDFTVVGSDTPLEEIEKRYARFVLEKHGGRRVEAAKALGISYPTFQKLVADDE